jgi:hypothetical protein
MWSQGIYLLQRYTVLSTGTITYILWYNDFILPLGAGVNLVGASTSDQVHLVMGMVKPPMRLGREIYASRVSISVVTSGPQLRSLESLSFRRVLILDRLDVARKPYESRNPL